MYAEIEHITFIVQIWLQTIYTYKIDEICVRLCNFENTVTVQYAIWWLSCDSRLNN